MSKKTQKKASKSSAKSAAGVDATRSSRAPAKSTAKAKARSKATKEAAEKAAPKIAARELARKTRRSPAARPTPADDTRKASASSSSAAAKISGSANRTGLMVGQKAPHLQLPRDGGGTVSLESYAGRNLVIFFYPRASTPGCTKEAMDFSRLKPEFDAVGTSILGVSADPVRTQDTFRDKHDLTIPLASDETHKTLEAFGVWGEKSLYGKTFLGIFRTTVLIGPDGRIRHVWNNVKVDGHAEAVLNYVQNL